MYAFARHPYFDLPPGLGASAGSEATALGGAAASSATSILAATGTIAASTVPIIGAGIALVTTLIGALIQNSGCGVTCVETSQWANQAEPLLQQNIAAYFAQPAPRSQSSQAAALQNFMNVWNTLQQQCSQAGTGAAGQRCISDRQSGACTWKQTTTSPLLAYPGEPQPGACWNWWSGYHDPIANDPDVAPDSVVAASSSTGSAAAGAPAGSSAGSSPAAAAGGVPPSFVPALAIGAAVLVLWAVFK